MLSTKGSFPADPIYQSQLRSSAARYIVFPERKGSCYSRMGSEMGKCAGPWDHQPLPTSNSFGTRLMDLYPSLLLSLLLLLCNNTQRKGERGKER